MSRAVVIGGGLAGRAALRVPGYDVTLIDRCQRLGGRAQVFERGGYRQRRRADRSHRAVLVRRTVFALGKNLSDYANLRQVPWYRFRYMDGTTFDYGGTAEEIARNQGFNPEDADGCTAFWRPRTRYTRSVLNNFQTIRSTSLAQ